MNGQQLTEITLARILREKYGLQDVYIADTLGTHEDRAQVLHQICRIAAMAFLDIVEKGDRIGVTWGETILALTEALPLVHVENVDVNQLIGSMIFSRVPAS